MIPFRQKNENDNKQTEGGLRHREVGKLWKKGWREENANAKCENKKRKISKKRLEMRKKYEKPNMKEE